MAHRYEVRYAMTNYGPVGVRTADKISAAKTRRIIERAAFEFGGTPVTLSVERWMRSIDTIGWGGVPYVHDEAA